MRVLVLLLLHCADAAPSPPPPLVPFGADPCTASSSSIDRCIVVLGSTSCASPSLYEGLQCLLISRPFYHAFLGATCTREGSTSWRLPINQCILSSDTSSRFTLSGTTYGLSISVGYGKGHAAYNTAYFNRSAPILADDRLVKSDGNVTAGFYPVVAIKAGMSITWGTLGTQIFEYPTSMYTIELGSSLPPPPLPPSASAAPPMVPSSAPHEVTDLLNLPAAPPPHAPPLPSPPLSPLPPPLSPPLPPPLSTPLALPSPPLSPLSPPLPSPLSPSLTPPPPPMSPPPCPPPAPPTPGARFAEQLRKGS